MNILLLTDGSRHSQEAARWLARHAAELRNPPRIVALYVHPPLPYPGAQAAAGRPAVERYYRETAEEALAPAARVLREANVEFGASYVVGEIVPSIADHVGREKVGLVVMGTHGHGAMMNLAMGSIATKCVATLPVPVLVVPRPT